MNLGGPRRDITRGETTERLPPGGRPTDDDAHRPGERVRRVGEAGRRA